MQIDFYCNPVDLHEYKKTIVYRLNKIIEEEFIYSVDNIVSILNIQRVYIQDNICSKLDNFNLDRAFKTYIRACMGSKKAFVELSEYVDLSLVTFEDFKRINEDIIELIKASGLDSYKLSRRILISKKQLKKLLLSVFSVEATKENKEDPIEYLSIDPIDADAILKYGLVNQAHLKQYFNVNTELQVYRRLAKGNSYVLRKYVIQVENDKKRGLARYLVNKDESLETYNEIVNTLHPKEQKID